MNVARFRGERLGCNVAFSLAHRLQFDAGQDPQKLDTIAALIEEHEQAANPR